VLAEGRTNTWGLGIAAVLAALGVSLYLLPPTGLRISLPGLFGYLAFFVRKSMAGGLQVSLQALRGRDALHPGIHEWRLTLPPGLPRVLLLNSLSLMPGTTGVELNDDLLRVHVLDDRQPVASDVEALQGHIARLFGACP
jgi:multicomponent Na+:H+ antiporter subunit E